MGDEAIQLDEVVVNIPRTLPPPYIPPTGTPTPPPPSFPQPQPPSVPIGGVPTARASDLSSKTFKVFVKVTSSYKQAGVRKLRIRVFDNQQSIYKTIMLPTYIVGVRSGMSDADAATFATDIINDMTDTVWSLYRISSSLPDNPTIVGKFEDLVKARFSLEGASFQRIGPQTDPRIIIGDAEYDLF
jgi:hypothetical protein